MDSPTEPNPQSFADKPTDTLTNSETTRSAPAIATALAEVNSRIHAACKNADRPRDSVTLIAVSKTKPESAVAAAAAAGQLNFAENYWQDAEPKIQAHPELTWHFVGRLQSNKTRPIAAHADWVQTVSRQKIAERLSVQRIDARGSAAPLNVLLQVNIDGDPNKDGVAPDEVLALARDVALLPGLRLRGLMTIPAQQPSDPTGVRPAFRSMAQCFEHVRGELASEAFTELSMGMTPDFEQAIAAGATMVRVGTAIFGQRDR